MLARTPPTDGDRAPVRAGRRGVATGRGAILAIVGAAAFLAVWAPAAGAAAELTCGSTPKGATQPVRATLALADSDVETVTSTSYGRRTGVRHLTLVYAVAGCRLPALLALPEDPPRIGPPKDSAVDTIPRGLIRLDGPPEIDGNRYVVHLEVFTSPPRYRDAKRRLIRPKFDPGSYAGFVYVRADWIHHTGTLVTVSRSENRWLSVLGAAVVGALGGFVFFMLLHAFSRAKLLAGPGKTVVAGIASVGIGTYVAYTTNFLNQDVWTFGANTKALLTAAFTAATSGQLVTGLLGKVYDDHAQVNPASEHRVQLVVKRVASRIVKPRRKPHAAAEAAPDAAGQASAAER